MNWSVGSDVDRAGTDDGRGDAMIRRTRRYWPRYSLRTFLLSSCLGGIAVAWLAHHYGEYRAEQVVLAEIVASVQSSTKIVRGQPQHLMMLW